MFKILEGKYKGLYGETVAEIGSHIKLKIETLDNSYTTWLMTHQVLEIDESKL